MDEDRPRRFAADKETRTASGLICLLTENEVKTVAVARNGAVEAATTAGTGAGGEFALRADPMGGRVRWSARAAEVKK